MRIYTLILANFLVAGVLLFSFFDIQTEAQQNPVIDGTTVTATVIDRIPPTTPILIAPEDDDKLKSGEVEFIWQESTDTWLMDHYTLVLNDEILFDDIPLTASSSSEYTLTYDSLTGYYSLTLLDALDDGDYSWSVTAWDYHGNSANSVTWSFSIDTESPEFTIIQIEDQEVEITTENADSVPTDPIILNANEPILSGTGEEDSEVELTITYPDGTTEEITFEIDGDGEWTITLPILPRDGVIYLNFLITDPTGNISILEDVPLILYTPVVEIPLPPFIPGVEEPVIEVPILPPSEYLPPVIRDTPDRVLYFIRNSTATVAEKFVSWIDTALTFILLLLLSALPLLKLGLLSNLYRSYLSNSLFKEFLWVIGWWGKKNPQGIVITRENQVPVQFGLVLLSGKSALQKTISKTLITNELGIFPHIDLPDGEYRISIHHPHYFFPSLIKASGHLDEFSYYSGAPILIKNGISVPALIIPVERLEKAEHTWSYQARKAVLLAPSLSIPMIFLSVCLCLAFPSILNIITLTAYTALFVRKKVIQSLQGIEVIVADTSKQPLPNVVVSFQKESSRQLAALVQTDKQGEARTSLSPGSYQIWCVDFKHSLMEGDSKTASSFKTDTSKDYLPLIMKKVS